MFKAFQRAPGVGGGRGVFPAVGLGTIVTAIGKATAHNKGDMAGGVKVAVEMVKPNLAVVPLGDAIASLLIGETKTVSKTAEAQTLNALGPWVFTANGYTLNKDGAWEWFAQDQKTVEVVAGGPAYDNLVVTLAV